MNASVHPKRSGLILIATLALSLLPPATRDEKAVADGSGHRLVHSIALEPPPVIPDRIRSTTYVSADKLAVVGSVSDAPSFQRAFTLDRNGVFISDWPASPSNVGWHPIAVAADLNRDRVYFSAGDKPLYVFDSRSNWIGTWSGINRDVTIWPQTIQVSPNGSVVALEGRTGEEAKIHRWDPLGVYKGDWPSSYGRYHDRADLAVDERGQVLLSNMKKPSGEPRSLIERFSERGAKLDELDLDWSSSLGPPAPGQDPKISFLSLATDQVRSSLLVFYKPQAFFSQHILRYTSEGVFQRGYPLWRLIMNTHPNGEAAAPHPTDGFALIWTPHNRVALTSDEDWGITQFDERGRLKAITRMTGGTRATLPEVWVRARLAGATTPVVLSSRSGIIGAPRPDRTYSWTQTAAPFTMDIAVAVDQSIASRGWDGESGRVTLWNADRSVAWSKPCLCPLATGIAIDQHRVYVTDPTTKRVIGLNRITGDRVGVLEPRDAQVGWPMDISAVGENRLFTINQSGWIEYWHWRETDQLLVRTWRVRNGHEPFAISAGAGLVGVLFSNGAVEVWNQEGQLIDRWSVEGASDISIDDHGLVAILDSLGSTIQVFKPSGEPSNQIEEGAEGSGICTIVGDKVASPTRVLLGEEVAIELTIRGSCPKSAKFADVVLVWDPDSIFWYDYPYARTVEAMHQFLDALDVPAIQTAIVGLGSGTEAGSVWVDFAMDRVAAHAVVSSTVRYDFATRDSVWRGKSKWPDLVATSRDYLERAGRPGAIPIVIFVGWQPFVPDTARASAEQFRAEGGKVLALQFPQYYPSVLQRLVASNDDVYHGSHAGDVAAVARRVRGLFADGEIRDIQVDDRLADQVGHVAGSTVPIASEAADRLVWTLDEIASAPKKMSYRVRADQVGQYVTNKEALAHYTDADGSRRTFRFPQPVIEVIAPTATMIPPTATLSSTAMPTGTLSPTPLPTSTRIPVPIYLPLLLREKCSPETRRVDMMIVLDASLSMLEPTASGSSRTKLQAAQAAASVMVETLRLESGDQIGIVVFNSSAHMLSPLTSQRSLLNQALASVLVAAQTCIVCGLETAIDEMESIRRRPENSRVLVLLTDGRSSPRPVTEAVAEADRGKVSEILIYTVGLGTDLDEDSLRLIASTPQHYRHVPNGDDLVQIYRDIAVEIPCSSSSFWSGRD